MAKSKKKSSNRIEQLCIRKGLRMTNQRRVIAGVLDKSRDHPNVEEVHRRVAKVDDGISLSTVYRTLKLFESRGILARHNFAEGRGVYEVDEGEHHDHLIDVKTGRVIEFQNQEIERLQDMIAKKLGYRLIGHRLELYGEKIGAKKAR